MMEPNNVTQETISQDNRSVFAFLSAYLNNAPDLIKKEEIDEIVACGVTSEYAFTLLLAAAFGLDINENADDNDLFNHYFLKMCHKLDGNAYSENPFYKNIKLPGQKIGTCELRYEKYQPFEGFVCNDILQTEAGRQIPQIGFFETEFPFPAVLENDRIWMTITPNEIETMRGAVDQAVGNVLTFGLGIGYYAYMISEKETVTRITVVENNDNMIQLFNRCLLPQFKNAQKIRVIQADAFEYAQQHLSTEKYDFVFTDLWHDVSDGIDMYLKMKKYEKESPGTTFMYWIEPSILCYLP